MKHLRAFLVFLFAALFVSASPKPIVILQVEEPRDSAFIPDRSALPASVKLTFDPLTSMFPAASAHATAVAQRLLAHPEYIAELQVQHEATYWGRAGIGIGRSSYSGATEIYPKPVGAWLVSNHSYGVMYPFGMDEALLKLDRRAERDNEVIVVALPDSGMGWTNFLGMPAPLKIASCAHNIIAVGSGRGAHDILPGARVDIVTDEDWTSYGAPKVAETAAAMISEALGAGCTYHWDEVRSAILDSADPMADAATFGHGRLNREAALKLWRIRKGIVSETPTVPAPILLPPLILSFSGPSQTLVIGDKATLTWQTMGAKSVNLRGFPVDASGSYIFTPVIGENVSTLTATNGDGTTTQSFTVNVRDLTRDEKRAQAAAAVGATYDAQSQNFSGLNAGAISQLVSELQSRGVL